MLGKRPSLVVMTAASILAAGGLVFFVPGVAGASKKAPSPGCTFNGATGQTTCVTVTQSATSVSGVSSNGTPLEVFDGVTGFQLCDAVLGNATWTHFTFSNLSFTVTTTTTTTTVRQGKSSKGHLVESSTASETGITVTSYTSFNCTPATAPVPT